MTVTFRDNDGTTRLAGDLLATGGATGDVLTQQANGTYAPTAAGIPDPVTSPVTIDLGALATAGGLEVTGTSGANVNRFVVDFLHTLLELTGDGVLNLSSDDTLGVTLFGTACDANLIITNTNADRTNVSATTQAGLTVSQSGAHQALITLYDSSSDRVVQAGITAAGAKYLVFKINAAPADASLNAGECALWFDQTNGAAKLMVKAKTANGTVVTGNVALA